MREEIKNLRINIDGLAQLTKSLHPVKYIVKFPDLKDEKEKEDFKYRLESYFKSSGLTPLPKSVEIEPFKNKEIEKATDSLYLAKDWMRKMLGELGEVTPYASGGSRKTVDDIEPTTNVGMLITINIDGIKNGGWEEMNHIEKVDWLRQEIERLITIFCKFPYIPDVNQRDFEIFKTNAFSSLHKARFWLGFELQK